MDVDAGVNVVEQIPTDVVGVVVNDKVVAAVPAPVSKDGPIPHGYFEVEAAGEPEAMVIAINPQNVEAVRRTSVGETTMLERAIDAETVVASRFVAEPLIVVDMGSFIDPAIVQALAIQGGRGRAPLRRRRNMSLIRTGRISVLEWCTTTTLGLHWDRYEEDCGTDKGG